MKTYQEKYLKYKTKYLFLKNSLQKGGGKTLTLIKADWCGHCKTFMKTWDELPFNIKNINFKILDSDNNKKEIERYNIKGYPSIFLENGNVIEFNGKRDIESLKKFVENN